MGGIWDLLMSQISVMIEQLLEIIDEAAAELGLWDHTTLGLNAIESELQIIDQKLEKHISPASIELSNPKQ